MNSLFFVVSGSATVGYLSLLLLVNCLDADTY